MTSLLHRGKNNIYPLILGLILVILSFSYLFLSFKGLNQPFAMDQAQIAREVARGNGMTTQFIRPLALSKTVSKQNNTAEKSLEAIRDTNHAPLNILVQSAAIFIAGGADFNNWTMEPNSMLYGLDRVIAATSLIFFFLSIFLIFKLVRRMFDDTIAGVTCALIIINDFFMQFAISGLPQMLMLFLFTLGCNYLYSAMQDQEEKKSPRKHLVLAAIFFTLLVLSNWITIWIMLGVIIFVSFHFRDVKLRTFPFIAFLLLGLAWPVYQNILATGNPFGTAIFATPGIFGGEEGDTMRALNQGEVQPFFDLIKGLVASAFSQIKNIIVNMGGIIIVPVFFICLFHKYRKPEINGFKIALLIIWCMSLLGMTICSDTELQPVEPTQIQLLLAPFFSAFALSMLFMIIARKANHSQERKLRTLSITLILLASAGSLLLTVPDQIRIGLLTSNRFRMNWPPYAPAALNGTLHKATESTASSLIATDQPWAVAWYADRPALWIPKTVGNLIQIDRLLEPSGNRIGGILFTPTSTMKTTDQIAASSGDFAPYAFEGVVLEYGNPVNSATLSSSAPSLAPLGNRFSGENSRLLLMGSRMIYYSSTPLPPALLN